MKSIAAACLQESAAVNRANYSRLTLRAWWGAVWLGSEGRKTPQISQHNSSFQGGDDRVGSRREATPANPFLSAAYPQPMGIPHFHTINLTVQEPRTPLAWRSGSDAWWGSAEMISRLGAGGTVFCPLTSALIHGSGEGQAMSEPRALSLAGLKSPGILPGIACCRSTTSSRGSHHSERSPPLETSRSHELLLLAAVLPGETSEPYLKTYQTRMPG